MPTVLLREASVDLGRRSGNSLPLPLESRLHAAPLQTVSRLQRDHRAPTPQRRPVSAAEALMVLKEPLIPNLCLFNETEKEENYLKQNFQLLT